MQPCSPFTAYRYWSTAIRNTLRFRPGEFFCLLARKPFFRYVIILCLYQQVSIAPAFIYICISKFPPTQLSFLSVSARIHSHSPHWYLYQQLFTASTLSFVCIIKYPQPQPSFLSVSARIHSHSPHWYLYQPLFTVSTLSFVCIIKYPQPQPSFLSVSASIQSPHSVLFVSASIHNPKLHLCLYQQVSCPSTLSCLYQQISRTTALTGICISNYSQPPHSIFFVSSSIHSPNPHFYLYQQISCPSTPKFFCISKYPQAQPPFLSVSATILSLHTQVFLYQQVSTGPTLLCICISQYPQPQTSLCLYQQVSAASTYSTPEVRALKKEQRQCLFEDEQALKIANSKVSRYSYSNCLVQCRLEHMDKLCHCAPYFYPTGGSLFVDLRGHIITTYCCEFGHDRRFKASVTSHSV